MGEFLGIAIVVLIIALPSIIRSFSGKEKKKKVINKTVADIRRELVAGLKVNFFESTIETKDGKKLPCLKITVSGSCQVLLDNFPCQLYVFLYDSTEGGGEKRYPVLCTIPELADDSGFLAYKSEFRMPYKITTFTDLPVLAFPAEAMILPKRGKRRVEAYVAFTPTGSNQLIKDGSAFKDYTQKEYGYLEYEQRSIETNRTIAHIAVAISASDGHIDKREAAVIKNYFSEQFARLQDPEKIKLEVSNVMKSAITKYKAKKLDTNAEIEKACKALVNAGRKVDIHAAYELAIRIIAADEEVQESERSALKRLAQLLEIPEDLSKEIQDKYFAVSMFAKDSEEALLDMPSGLTVEEKRQFLNKEYQKWRGRVNHQDEKIRTQAELRIQAITRARKKLQSVT